MPMTPSLALIVDDEEVFREIVSATLRASGFATVTADTVADALKKAHELHPCVVVSDIFMPPGPSGWELARALRRNRETSDIKIVFFTSLQDPWLEVPKDERDAVASELGDVEFFDKTDDMEMLSQKVLHLVEGDETITI